MDFIVKLPKSQGKETIWVVVDKFTKYGHFIALSSPMSASQLAQVFVKEVYRLHGLPEWWYNTSHHSTIQMTSFEALYGYSPLQIGVLAYELQLPQEAKVHSVFHVSQLKKHEGKVTRVVATLHPLDEENQFLLIPVVVLERRMVKNNNTAQVQWAHLPKEEATWEIVAEMEATFPDFKELIAYNPL
ncbi:hypothetical protein ACP275_06G149200 [Erythranthe tilingii]